jgi:hypothetical protein
MRTAPSITERRAQPLCCQCALRETSRWAVLAFPQPVLKEATKVSRLIFVARNLSRAGSMVKIRDEAIGIEVVVLPTAG